MLTSKHMTKLGSGIIALAALNTVVMVIIQFVK
jgi:hypothetical protein